MYSMQELRKNLSEAVSRAEHRGERVGITRNGRLVAMLVPGTNGADVTVHAQLVYGTAVGSGGVMRWHCLAPEAQLEVQADSALEAVAAMESAVREKVWPTGRVVVVMGTAPPDGSVRDEAAEDAADVAAIRAARDEPEESFEDVLQRNSIKLERTPHTWTATLTRAIAAIEPLGLNLEHLDDYDFAERLGDALLDAASRGSGPRPVPDTPAGTMLLEALACGAQIVRGDQMRWTGGWPDALVNKLCDQGLVREQQLAGAQRLIIMEGGLFAIGAKPRCGWVWDLPSRLSTEHAQRVARCATYVEPA